MSKVAVAVKIRVKAGQRDAMSGPGDLGEPFGHEFHRKANQVS